MPRQEEARKLPTGSPLELHKKVFLPLLAAGPKRCDELGYAPRVAQKALERLRDHGLVRSRNMTIETPAGKVVRQYWLLASAPDPVELLPQTFLVAPSLAAMPR